MRPEGSGSVRWNKSAMFLGLVLAIGISAMAKERSGMNAGQQSNNQAPISGHPLSPGTAIPSTDSPEAVTDPAVRAHLEAARLKAANDDRHKKLVADVNQLLSLTNELKTDVDKTDKDELSLEVVRKAQEIEKLAHDVQSRMRN